MARIHAIADLHLSGNGDKPMDVFGEIWAGHAEKMARRWDATVSAGDWVLLAGDLSWARNLREAAVDLEWIAARPGRKLLMRGNHDGWWGSVAKVRAALPDGCELLHNEAVRIGDHVVVGSRGWTAPDDPAAGENDGRIFARELARLDRTVEDADRRFDRGLPRIAMAHFPPRLAGREPTAVVERLQAAGVRVCVYGHLHGDDHRFAVDGEVDGILYRFVAVDAVDFTPVPIVEEA